MSRIPDDIARRAAAVLAAEFGPGLAAQVEARLHPGVPAQRFIEPVSVALASLLVSLSSLALAIYRDLGKDAAAKPAPEVLARRIRIEIGDTAGVTPVQRDRIIAVVVDEILNTPTH